MSDDDDTYAEFSDAVNMTAKQIEGWLQTEESKEVGQKKGGGRVDRARDGSSDRHLARARRRPT